MLLAGVAAVLGSYSRSQPAVIVAVVVIAAVVAVAAELESARHRCCCLAFASGQGRVKGPKMERKRWCRRRGQRKERRRAWGRCVRE